MVFSSLTFLFVFLPIVLLIYYISLPRYKNHVLLIASLCFYGFGEPKYLLLLIASCVLNYGFGICIEKQSNKKQWLLLALLVNIGLLIYFKYIDFIITNINLLFQQQFSLTYVILPIGISFFTFQCIGYVIDVSTNKVKASHRFLDFATYVTLFPQLIAGPIVRYQDIALSLKQREHSLNMLVQGLQRFIIGLAKKVLIANTMATLITSVQPLPESILQYWLIAVAFSLQLYFDFSGYSDMAIGLGKMFGFTFLENFNYPYVAKSISEFWRRWHISLSSWFRDYVYIPLKGSRVNKARFAFNLFVVWGCTGLWHGAQWNFVLWGVYFAVLLLIEKWFLATFLKKHPIFAHTYTLFFVVVGFVIFQNETQDIVHQLSAMFGFAKLPLFEENVLYYLQSYGVLLGISMVMSIPMCRYFYQTYIYNKSYYRLFSYVEIIFYSVLLILCIAFIVDSSFQPFLYFRF